MPVLGGDSPCLACAVAGAGVPGMQATCSLNGVLASTVAQVASLQFVEAIKVIVGARQSCMSGMHFFNAWEHSYLQLPVIRSDDCSVCARRQFPYLQGRRQLASRTLCGRTAIQLHRREVNDAFIEQQAARAMGRVRRRSSVHLEVTYEADSRHYILTFFRDGRVIVDGTVDEREAKRVLAEASGY